MVGAYKQWHHVLLLLLRTGYCTNETEVADQLYSMLTQFYAMFPELLTNDLYVAGEVSSVAPL